MTKKHSLFVNFPPYLPYYHHQKRTKTIHMVRTMRDTVDTAISPIISTSIRRFRYSNYGTKRDFPPNHTKRSNVVLCLSLDTMPPHGRNLCVRWEFSQESIRLSTRFWKNNLEINERLLGEIWVFWLKIWVFSAENFGFSAEIWGFWLKNSGFLAEILIFG